MGKKNGEASAHHSSIALLQERFRQLERIKELREEREQNNKALNDARRSPSTCYEQQHQQQHQQQQQQPTTSKWFIHPELINPSSSNRSSEEEDEIQNFETPIAAQPRSYGEGDVDTSLHL